MSFTDSPVRGAMLVMLNGEGGQSRTLCKVCGRPLLRAFFTARVRQIDPAFPTHQDVCINPSWKIGVIPCPEALKAKELIDRLMEASRR